MPAHGDSGRIDGVGQLLLGERDPTDVQRDPCDRQQRQQDHRDIYEDRPTLVGAKARQERNEQPQHDTMQTLAPLLERCRRACGQREDS
jgi:hypothetical protein